ncbi:MAG: hypothetical protein MUC88_27085 [Planctomycetes bacterium]|jgi:hypothetical protein|nr:hypothetical protein [Planctomycetota bacterium]
MDQVGQPMMDAMGVDTNAVPTAPGGDGEYAALGIGAMTGQDAAPKKDERYDPLVLLARRMQDVREGITRHQVAIRRLEETLDWIAAVERQLAAAPEMVEYLRLYVGWASLVSD